MMTFVEAIARMEGFGADTYNIPTRHRNPGDISAGQWANCHGAIPAAPDPKQPQGPPSRYAVFPDAQTGWTALRKLLAAHYAGMTVEEAISKYAPATENHTGQYIAYVCEWTGMRPSTVLSWQNLG
jgi:hypothetical protein